MADSTAPIPPPSPEPDPAASQAVSREKAAVFRHLRDEAETTPSPAPVDPGLASERARLDLESLVGGRWFAVAGALIFIVGVGLLVRLAVKEGWFGGLPPLMKCATGAGLGVAILGIAELLRKRVHAWALVGLNAAGLGALFASAYAVFGVYELVGAPAAAGLLAACTAVGVAVSARTRLAPVAIVALLGGYLSPILLSGDTITPMVTPLYLGMLLVTGLVLSTWLGGAFMVARVLTWWFSLGLGAFWVYRHASGLVWSSSSGHPEAGLAFIAFVWLAIHAELVWTSLRLDAKRIVPPTQWLREDWAGWDSWRPVTTSTSTTIWAMVLATPLTKALGVPIWAPAAAGAVLTLIMGFSLASGLRVLRETPRTIAQRLGAGLTMQAGALLIAAVALSISGWTQSVVWLSLGLGAALAGGWMRSRALIAYGAIVLLLCTCRILLFDVSDGELITHRVTALGLVLSRWTLLMVITGAAWITLGLLFSGKRRPESVEPEFPRTAIAVGSMLALGSVINVGAESTSIASVWILASAAIVLAARFTRSTMLQWAGAAIWFAAAVVLLCTGPADLSRGLERGLERGPLFLPVTGAALVAGGVGLWIAAGLRARFPRHPWIGIMNGIAIGAFALFALVPTSVESHRLAVRFFTDPTAHRAALSVWWAVCGLGIVATGFMLRSSHARLVGLGLLGVVASKVLIFDLMGVSLLWRTISFLVVGVAMLIVAVAYGWLNKQLPPTPRPAPSPAPTDAPPLPVQP